jgi:hypothetical protein
LQAAQTSALQSEMRRQQGASVKMEPLAVAIRSHPMVVNGRLDDWAGAAWALIDSRLTQEGDWGKRQKKTEGAVAISQDKLYAAFKTDDPDLLNNSGESPQNLFKTGGCLDLMIGAPSGGERLLISRVKGKTVAVLYRPNAPGATTEPILFQSPIRTVKFDRVDDVSDQVVLASGVENDPEDKTRTTIYEVSCPLTLLGLNPHPGQTIQGDIGILRGNGFQTLQRVYWHNKATGLVSDLPSEVELTPQLWGDWQFEAAP